MLQYADDVFFAAQKWNTEPRQRGSNFWGTAASLGWTFTKFNFAWSSLDMMRKGPKKGFYVPWTRFVPNQNNYISGAGTGMGLWGKEGLGNWLPNEEAMGLIRRYGSKAATATLSKTVGEVAAKKMVGTASAAMIVGTAASVAMGVAGAAMVAKTAWDIGTAIWKPITQNISKYWGLELGGYFPETQGSYTSRQRNLQAITASQLQARSAIGNEAMLFHR